MLVSEMLWLLLILLAFAIPLVLLVFVFVKVRRKRIALPLIYLASVIIFSLPGVIKTFQAMMIYGTDDRVLMLGGFREAVKIGVTRGIVFALILGGIFWLVQYRRAKIAEPKPEWFD